MTSRKTYTLDLTDAEYDALISTAIRGRDEWEDQAENGELPFRSVTAAERGIERLRLARVAVVGRRRGPKPTPDTTARHGTAERAASGCFCEPCLATPGAWTKEQRMAALGEVISAGIAPAIDHDDEDSCGILLGGES